LDQNTQAVLAAEDAALEKALQDSQNNVPIEDDGSFELLG
jgi:hypothetical protein